MTLVERTTAETQIRVTIDDAQSPSIATTIPFLDHMLGTLARYSGLALSVDAHGDLAHHIIEDSAIAIGVAVAQRIPAACARYGVQTIPMDDALVECAIDVGGRAYYGGRLPSRIYDHWMRSFADSAKSTVHIRVLRGHDRHHVVEAGFKALGLALRAALASADTTFSTKGSVRLTVTP
jgi:imidazoleglycerol-phosphate dehydratase